MSLMDVDQLRAQTPGCSSLIHFNNAGAALPPQGVVDAQIEHLRRESLIGGYEAAEIVASRLDEIYALAARLINGHPDEIALVDNATRAWQLAFYALPLNPGARILTATAAYGSNFIAFLHRAKQTGAVVEVIPDDENGQIDLTVLAHRITDPSVRLVALTHVPTNGGLVNPAAAVGMLANDAGVPFLLDACQSVGQLPVDVEEIGCDMLSATGRKYLRAPRGTGFLWIRRRWIERLEPPMIDARGATWTDERTYTLRPDARRFECWESSIGSRLGLAEALSLALELGSAPIWQRIQDLAAALRRRLGTIDGVQVHDKGAVRCGIVTFTMAGHEPVDVQQQLRAQLINLSVTWASMSRLDMDPRGLSSMLRASVHVYNTFDEIERFCLAIAAIR
ncbi:MAG: aminotransferase class V-fold PLP-dependent enzyme [Myxococcota bacterium]